MKGRWTFLGMGLTVLFVLFGLCHEGFAVECYTVKPGDSLYSISKTFGVSIEALKKANTLEGDSIKPKQALTIPSGGGKQPGERANNPGNRPAQKSSAETVKKPASERAPYVVQKGDSLFSISKKSGRSIEEIKKMNSLHSPALKIGQVLLLTKRETRLDDEAEELGDAEEVAEGSQTEEGKGEQVASNSIEKWNNPEERNLFIRVVKTFLGVPYRLGGSTLRGIDCSALVKKIYEIFSVDLPRTAREQFRIGKRVERDQLEEGDLVFFRTRRGNNAHVGIYIGNREFVHASTRKKEVKIDHLDMPYFSTRFLTGVRVKELERES